MISITKCTTINPDEIKNIENQHRRYEKLNNIDIQYEKFYIVIKNKNDLIGCLTAYTAYQEIYIEDLIIFEKYRNCGYGKLLILELENLFKDQNYNNINLATNEFQAVDFYKKCGFEIEFIRKNTKDPQLNKYFFVKYF